MHAHTHTHSISRALCVSEVCLSAFPSCCLKWKQTHEFSALTKMWCLKIQRWKPGGQSRAAPPQINWLSAPYVKRRCKGYNGDGRVCVCKRVRRALRVALQNTLSRRNMSFLAFCKILNQIKNITKRWAEHLTLTPFHRSGLLITDLIDLI